MRNISTAHGLLYLLADFIVVALHHHWFGLNRIRIGMIARARVDGRYSGVDRRAHAIGVHAGLRARRESCGVVRATCILSSRSGERCSGRCKSISMSASELATVAMQPPEYSVV